jgi:hypothetical protein
VAEVSTYEIPIVRTHYLPGVRDVADCKLSFISIQPDTGYDTIRQCFSISLADVCVRDGRHGTPTCSYAAACCHAANQPAVGYSFAAPNANPDANLIGVGYIGAASGFAATGTCRVARGRPLGPVCNNRNVAAGNADSQWDYAFAGDQSYLDHAA